MQVEQSMLCGWMLPEGGESIASYERHRGPMGPTEVRIPPHDDPSRELYLLQGSPVQPWRSRATLCPSTHENASEPVAGPKTTRRNTSCLGLGAWRACPPIGRRVLFHTKAAWSARSGGRSWPCTKGPMTGASSTVRSRRPPSTPRSFRCRAYVGAIVPVR